MPKHARRNTAGQQDGPAAQPEIIEQSTSSQALFLSFLANTVQMRETAEVIEAPQQG
jgi:hypothetical protein